MYEYLDRRYALALYEVADKKNKVDTYLEDLKQIVYLIKNDKDVQDVIKHPQVSTAKKRKIFNEIFKNKIEDELLAFLLILIDKGRILYLEEKLLEMEKIFLERNNMVSAVVTTVISLNDSQRFRLIEKLQKKYNKKIVLKENIDESIIGGVYIRVGDDVIDGTIKGRVGKIKKVLFNAEVR